MIKNKSKKKTPSKTIKTKRRKKGGYHTGIHNSPKCEKPISYRSGWELTVAKIFDEDDDILCYSYESVGIAYRSPNLKSTKIRRYFPDFFVTYTDGRRIIIEIKRDDRINNKWTIAKGTACRKWAEKQNIQYQIWGAKEINEAKLLLEIKKKSLKQKMLIPA